MITNLNLPDTTILADVSIGRFRNLVEDKRVSEEIAESHAATDKAGRYNKYLFPSFTADGTTIHTFPELNAVLTELNKFYAWHYASTLAWDGDGTRILAASKADEHKAKADDISARLPDLLSALRVGYADAMDRAKVKLNGMWRASDYPSAQAMCDKFYVNVAYKPVPTTVSSALPASIQALLRDNVENQTKSATEAAIGEAYSRLYKVVERMHARLNEPKAVFRDSLVDNVKDVCDTLKIYSGMSPQLAETIKTIESDLIKSDAQTLRDNDNLRASIAGTAGNLLASMRGVRKITKASEAVNGN